MIRAYPAEPTVPSGAPLVLHVATDAPRFRVRFVRAGTRPTAVGEPTAWLPGRDARVGRCDTPWPWPPYELPLSAAFPPGAYVARCETDGDEAVTALDERSAAALFVIAPRRRAPIAVNLPLFTYHAYNQAEIDGRAGVEGACLYSGPRAVTLHRPGGGTGGHPWDAVHVDPYDPASPRQTFAHYDAKALAWLEARGYAFDVVTDLDLHRGDALRERSLLLAFGHQEYWTREMRAAVEQHLGVGGNVAFFCGNTAWFRIRYDAARHAIVRDGKWSDDHPEEAFTGTSYRFGGGCWRGERPPTGYTVVDPSHWSFAGCELSAGSMFGAEARLVGYECDGAAPSSGAQVLAAADLHGWPREERGEVLGGRATIVELRRGAGTVYNVGTVDWARLLATGDRIVDRITATVIERLSAPPRDRAVAAAGAPATRR